MRPVQVLEGDQVVEYPVVQATLTQALHGARAGLHRAEQARARSSSTLPHAMPHKPLAASEEFYKKSGAGLYGDAIAELDGSVGQVLATLKELGLDENTLVLFTSDNGAWFGGSTGGLRGMKGSSYEGGYRVPMIARWPGKIPAGHVSAQPAVMMDLFATVLKAATVAAPGDRVLDGRDILPLLHQRREKPARVDLRPSELRARHRPRCALEAARAPARHRSGQHLKPGDKSSIRARPTASPSSPLAVALRARDQLGGNWAIGRKRGLPLTERTFAQVMQGGRLSHRHHRQVASGK